MDTPIPTYGLANQAQKRSQPAAADPIMTNPGARLAGKRLPTSSSNANPGAKVSMQAATTKTAVNGAAKTPAEG